MVRALAPTAVERGFGCRGARSCADRGLTAVSQLKPGDIDWEQLFGKEGVRWFHTGGIFAALSETTADVVIEALKAAKKYGTVTSYDLNYRASLWKSIGGQAKAQAVNKEIARYVDVMIGNEEDFTAALGIEVEGVDKNLTTLPIEGFKKMIEKAVSIYPSRSTRTSRPSRRRFAPSSPRLSTTGRRSAGTRASYTSRSSVRGSRSTTALAAAIRSLRGLSTAL